MQVYEMRRVLKRAPRYTSTPQAASTWCNKVDRMSDNQVIAVFFRMKRGGEL